MGNDQIFNKVKAAREKRKNENRGRTRDKILIICEGEKTEPHYFECFRNRLKHSKKVKIDIDGCGNDPATLVKKAKEKIKDYDKIWCVFDRDKGHSRPPEQFNIPFQLSEKQKETIKTAYSNDAFELWYLLHFDYYTSAIHRSKMEDMLTDKLGYEYQKNSETMYDELLDKLDIAIDNAKKLLDSYPEFNPEKNNPSTTVHLLVEELKNHIDKLDK